MTRNGNWLAGGKGFCYTMQCLAIQKLETAVGDKTEKYSFNFAQN